MVQSAVAVLTCERIDFRLDLVVGIEGCQLFRGNDDASSGEELVDLARA